MFFFIRDRSNVEAMSGNMTETAHPGIKNAVQFTENGGPFAETGGQQYTENGGPFAENGGPFVENGVQFGHPGNMVPAMDPMYPHDPQMVEEDLGPLPPNWEQAFTEKGEPYFIE